MNIAPKISHLLLFAFYWAGLAFAQDLAPPAVPPEARQPAAEKEVEAEKKFSASHSLEKVDQSKEQSLTSKVVVIKVGEKDLMGAARFQFMSKTLERASRERAEAVIFDLDTPGGLAWDTTTFIMRDLQGLKIKSFAFVNPRALSAGALIAAGTDAIYMSPASSIGAASPVSGTGEEMGAAERAKMNSAIMSMARSVAANKGHNPAVLDAMIDKDVGLKVGEHTISEKGRILTLTATEATTLYDGKPLFAKGVIESIEELLQKENLKGEMVRVEPRGFEYFAVLISQYAAILIAIGLIGGYVEMQTPGFGIPGIVSCLAFGLFFFGHYVAGSLVGYEVMFLFILGVILVVVEFFLFPGFILPGVLGALLIGASLVLTMSAWDFKLPEDGGLRDAITASAVIQALFTLSLGVFAFFIAMIVVMRFLPQSRAFAPMVLATNLEGPSQANIDGDSMDSLQSLQLGMTGVSLGALRPYGPVKFGEFQTSAKSEQSYIGPNEKVVVIAIHQGTVIVKEVS